MSAKDYRICTSMFRAYIAKTNKDEFTTTNDKREISEEEIMSLIDWWLTKKFEDSGNNTQYISANNETIIELKKLNFNNNSEN